MLKSVLIVAYYFPPMGLGGVQRMLKLAKYLPEYGFKVHVLTVKPVSYPAYDESLLSELPSSVEIHRAGSQDPSRIAKLLGISFKPPSKIKTLAKNKGGMWPDSKIGWKKKAVRLGQEIIRRENIDVILSSSPPITSHLVAIELSELCDVPYVADFRDIWESRPPEELYSDEITIKKSHDLLARIAQSASVVTGINNAICERISSVGEVIPGGFDPDDFRDVSGNTDDAFTLCYLGSVGQLHPLEPFFKAAQIASQKNKELESSLRFLIIGKNNNEEILSVANQYGLREKVRLTGYTPHKQAVQLASSCSVSILSVPSGYNDILTGKIFDYLALPIPTLAVVPPHGEAAKLIQTHIAGICVSPDDTHAIAEAMIELFKRKQTGETWRKKDVDKLTRKHAAGQFAKIINRVTGER
ncbi:MAG: glycosyltransferase family 4 protein [candidate division Zixibacteria bacterium]|nr:glycosyltransferase family 4 protein [candidate division Zixibacteria bacterium]